MTAQEKLNLIFKDDTPSLPKARRIIPTGFSVFDNEILGTGGWPSGGLINLYGDPTGGKSLLAIRSCAMAQKMEPDRIAVIIDTEFRFVEDWANRQGLDTSPERFALWQGNFAEKTFERILKLVNSGVVSIIVIDSLSNLIAEKYAGSDMWKTNKEGELVNKQQVANKASYNTLFVQQLVSACIEHDVVLLNISQLRTRIGVLYGNPDTFPGGHAFKHNLSISAKVRAVEPITDGDTILAYRVGVNVEKNTFAIKAKTDDTSHLVFYLDGGLEKSEIMGLYDEAIRKDFLIQKGAWFSLVDKTGTELRKWQGTKNVVNSFMSEPELLDVVSALVK